MSVASSSPMSSNVRFVPHHVSTAFGWWQESKDSHTTLQVQHTTGQRTHTHTHTHTYTFTHIACIDSRARRGEATALAQVAVSRSAQTVALIQCPPCGCACLCVFSGACSFLLTAMLNDRLLDASDAAPRKPRTALLLTLALVAAMTLAAVFIGLYVHEAHKSAPAVDPSPQIKELQAQLQSARAVAAEAQLNATTAQAVLANTSSELFASAVRLNVTATTLHHTAAQLMDSQELVADLRKNGVPPPSPTTLSAETREWILSAMDLTADPCEDFTQFTCGAWQAANPVVTPQFGEPQAIKRAFGNVSARLTQAEQDVLANKFEEAAQVRAWVTHAQLEQYDGRASILCAACITSKAWFSSLCYGMVCSGSITMVACRDRSWTTAIRDGQPLSPR